MTRNEKIWGHKEIGPSPFTVKLQDADDVADVAAAADDDGSYAEFFMLDEARVGKWRSSW